MPTDRGLCQTFNGLPLTAILKSSEWLNKFQDVFSSSEDVTEVKKASGIGQDNGFIFVVDNLFTPLISKGKSLFFKCHNIF